MQLLASPPDEPPQTIAALGVGLVGGAVCERLRQDGWRSRTLPLSWTSRERRATDLRTLAGALRQAAAGGSQVRLLWTAGRAGFGSSAADVESEVESLDDVLRALGGASAELTNSLDLHFVSSLGGIFEGQRRIDLHSRPAPRRPYGHLKARQEALLATSPFAARSCVYRLSSVYGAPTGRQRRGLIPTLIENGRRGASTRIVGRLDTLRDFVWAEDIGRYLAGRLRRPLDSHPPTTALASGKPSSIHEVIDLVERQLRRRVPVSFAAELTNSLDITVAPEALPPGWHPTDLTTAIGALAARG